MAGSGQLERAVLQVLWDATGPVPARDVLAALTQRDPAQRELAVTTVLTVLDRLRRKGLVRRERDGRAHRYQASVSREDYVADLMLEALGQAPDRSAALTRFLGGVSPADTDHLRRTLGGPGSGPPGVPGVAPPRRARRAADAVLLAAEGLALIAVAVVLAVPVPLALARAAWPARSPRAALVLWQAVGLGGGLAILGAGVTLAVSGLHRSWLGGLGVLPGRLWPGHAVVARGAHSSSATLSSATLPSATWPVPARSAGPAWR